MADGHTTTPNPSSAPLPSLRETMGFPPVRTMTEIDLQDFITPLVHATRVLSAIDPDELRGIGGAEAYTWLSSFAHDRAHELQSIINGHQPLYLTGSEAAERAEKLAELPTFSEWTASQHSRLGGG